MKSSCRARMIAAAARSASGNGERATTYGATHRMSGLSPTLKPCVSDVRCGALGVPVRDDLRATCRASLDRLLTQLAGDLSPDVDAAALTVDTGRRRARQGVPLEVVLRAYRQCGRLVWERMRAVSRARFGGEHDAALKSFSQVYALNIDYRDVAERIAALQKPAR